MGQDLKSTVIRYALPVLVPLAAVALALFVGAAMIFALGASPLQGYAALLGGAFGTVNATADTLVRATPLLLVAVGVCIAFRGGVFNIGGEGQLIIGAVLTTVFVLVAPAASPWLVIPVALLLGLLGGALWGGIAGFLKARFGVNEILSTIMMNAIALQLMNYLLGGPLMDPVQVQKGTFLPETARFAEAFDLPRLVPTRLHLGAGVAVLCAILAWLLLWRTTVGYRIRAVGLNTHSARYAGIPLGSYAMLALTLSGALCGLAGAIQALGVLHRMVTDGSPTGFTANAGFNGIVVALFGGLHPLGAIPASILFGGLLTGANKLQRVTQVPAALVMTLNGLVVLFVVGAQWWAQYRGGQARVSEDPAEQASAGPESPAAPGELKEAT